MIMDFFGASIEVRLNDRLWHDPDLQRLLELGPITTTLPTFGPECRFTG